MAKPATSIRDPGNHQDMELMSMKFAVKFAVKYPVIVERLRKKYSFEQIGYSYWWRLVPKESA